jgi:acyl-CoA synthetase (AMP-forming)/AMP-acid ligase II
MAIKERIISSCHIMPSHDLPAPTSYHQLFAYRGRTVPDSPWFYYPEPVAAEEYRVLTYKGADDLISHLAAQYAEILPARDESTISKSAPKAIPEPPMVVATLASNNVQLALTGLAAQRMQHSYIHVSPLNSDSGIATLLKNVDARVLLADNVFFERAEKLVAQIEGLQLYRMINFDPVDELKKDLKTFDYDSNKDEGRNSGLIFHTSGTSSSAPKPIWHANCSFLAVPPMAVRKTTLTTGLMYHGMGGGLVLMAANIAGSVAFPLAKDPNYRTIPEVIKSLKALPQLDVLVLHPILIEALYEHYGRNNSPELEYLKRVERIETGGGKLAHKVAQAMRAAGVNVVSFIWFPQCHL